MKYCDPYVGLYFFSDCLSVCSHNSKTTRPNFKFCACRLWPWLGTSSGGIAIRYVLPVLWMTSYFHILTVLCISKWRHNATHIATEIQIKNPIWWTVAILKKKIKFRSTQRPASIRHELRAAGRNLLSILSRLGEDEHAERAANNSKRSSISSSDSGVQYGTFSENKGSLVSAIIQIHHRHHHHHKML